MKVLKTLFYVGSVSASILLTSTAKAAPTGVGNIDAQFVSADRLVLDYTVKGNGGGTAEFICKLVSPSGKVYEQKKVSTYWQDGKASAQFVYGNIKEGGYYSATCLWNPYKVGVTYKSILR
jgi:hypothetical protein